MRRRISASRSRTDFIATPAALRGRSADRAAHCRRCAIVGMSAKMVERYCRNADLRVNSRAALMHLERAMAR